MKSQLRNYAGSDAYLLEQSAVLQKLFETDLALFNSLDTTLNEAFKTAWQTAHTEALNQPDDSIVVAQLSQKTAELMELSKQAGVLWRSIKYFVQKAFPNNSSVLAEFGSNDYYEASRKNERMIMFLDELQGSVTRYKSALIKAGLPSSEIKALSQFQEKFQETNTEQELLKRKRLVKTQTRIDSFNALYTIVTQIIAAAAIVFRDDVARKSQYVYAPNTTPAESNDQEIYTDTVESNTLKEVATIPYAPQRLLRIKNTGAVALSFYLSMDGTVSELSPFIVDTGREVDISMAQLANTGDLLMVMNGNATAGSYEITVSME